MSEKGKNGKGDKPRNCFSKKYKDNYDRIFRKQGKTNKKITDGDRKLDK
jgi:hypothetical protein